MPPVHRVDHEAVCQMSDDAGEHHQIDFAVPRIFRVLDYRDGARRRGKNENQNSDQGDDPVSLRMRTYMLCVA